MAFLLYSSPGIAVHYALRIPYTSRSVLNTSTAATCILPIPTYMYMYDGMTSRDFDQDATYEMQLILSYQYSTGARHIIVAQFHPATNPDCLSPSH